MNGRTTGGITLWPSSNYQGGVLFFSHTSREELDYSGTDFTLAPIPQDTIDRVEHMARVSPTGLPFTDRHNNPLDATDSVDNPGPITNCFVESDNTNCTAAV